MLYTETDEDKQQVGQTLDPIRKRMRARLSITRKNFNNSAYEEFVFAQNMLNAHGVGEVKWLELITTKEGDHNDKRLIAIELERCIFLFLAAYTECLLNKENARSHFRDAQNSVHFIRRFKHMGCCCCCRRRCLSLCVERFAIRRKRRKSF